MNEQEFANKIRAKYPGAYDNVSDTELTNKVIAKYPVYASQLKSFNKTYSEITPLQPETQSTSFGQKLLDTGTAVTNFLGGKSVQETFGAEIAKLKATPEERQFITQPTVGETAGSSLQLGSLFIPVGSLAKGVGLGAKALGLSPKITQVAGNVVAGAATGAAFDVGEKLQTGETSGLATVAGGAIPLAGPIVKGAKKLTGAIARETLGKTTGAGAGAIQEGLRASVAGGEKAKAFTSALRGGTTPEAIVDEAKAGLQTIIQDRRNTYLSQLEKIAGNKESLDISPIIKQVGDNLEKFNIGVAENGTLDFSRSALRFNTQAQKDITQIVDTMKGYGTQAGDRTAVQVDNLKQALSDLYSPSGQARAFVEAVRKTTREVLSQVPGYDELARNYSDKTELIQDISKGLSLGDKANIDTSFKKLTSALRQNNEFRQELVQELDQATGGYLSSKIAGQQLSPLLPRGLSGILGTVGGAGALTTGVGLAKLLPAIVAFSPRAVGELVVALGFTGNKAKLLTEFLTKNAGKIAFPGDTALQGAKQDIKNFNQLPNKQGGFVRTPNFGKENQVNSILNLESEAKKYKTAEEFVKKQSPISHYTAQKFDKFDLDKTEAGSIWFTDNSKIDLKSGQGLGSAQVGTGGSKYKMDRYINPKAKIIDIEKSDLTDKYTTGQLIDMGYSGIKVPQLDGSNWYEIFNPDTDLLTKSQLIDIWKKANKK